MRIYLGLKENYIQKEFYENGNIKHEIHFQNKVENGKAKYYYDNGSYEYFRNGNASVQAKQEMGKLIDTSTYYFENRNLNRQVLFKDNKAVILNMWDSSGVQKIKNGISN